MNSDQTFSRFLTRVCLAFLVIASLLGSEVLLVASQGLVGALTIVRLTILRDSLNQSVNEG